MAGYVELNDFLAPESRGRTVRRPFRTHQTVKDVVEAMGIPHTEVDLILVDGEPVDFVHRSGAGDRIAVYCGRVYWRGSHHGRLVNLVAGLRDQLQSEHRDG